MSQAPEPPGKTESSEADDGAAATKPVGDRARDAAFSSDALIDELLAKGGSAIDTGAPTVAVGAGAIAAATAPSQPAPAAASPVRPGGLAMVVLLTFGIGWILPSPLFVEEALPTPRILTAHAEDEEMGALLRLAEAMRSAEERASEESLAFHERIAIWGEFAALAEGTSYADYAQTEIEVLKQAELIEASDVIDGIYERLGRTRLPLWVEAEAQALDAFVARYPGLYREQVREIRGELEAGRLILKGTRKTLRYAVTGEGAPEVSEGLRAEIEHATVEGTFLRFNAAGRSRLTLTFEVSEPGSKLRLAAFLVLATIGELREGYLTIALNGAPLTSHWSPANAISTRYLWETDGLVVGENTLTIGLDAEALNQVWLQRLTLRVVNEPS